jgi:hypothetical protein
VGEKYEVGKVRGGIGSAEKRKGTNPEINKYLGINKYPGDICLSQEDRDQGG